MSREKIAYTVSDKLSKVFEKRLPPLFRDICKIVDKADLDPPEKTALMMGVGLSLTSSIAAHFVSITHEYLGKIQEAINEYKKEESEKVKDT